MLFALGTPSLIVIFFISVVSIIVFGFLVEVRQRITNILELNLWSYGPEFEGVNFDTLDEAREGYRLKFLVHEISDLLGQSNAIGSSGQGLPVQID
jgi:hypothetical protein